MSRRSQKPTPKPPASLSRHASQSTSSSSRLNPSTSSDFDTAMKLTGNFLPSIVEDGGSTLNDGEFLHGQFGVPTATSTSTSTNIPSMNSTAIPGQGRASSFAQSSNLNTSHFTSDFTNLYDDPLRTLQDNIRSNILIQIQNIVGTVDLNATIDLRAVAMAARNAEYNPRRFLSVVLKLRNPRVTGLLFKSGKLVVTGAKTEYELRIGARKLARLVQKLGHEHVTFNDFTIHNILGSADVRFPVNLDKLVVAHSKFASYDPEVFPALVYRLQNPPLSCMIFVSGKVVITGARSRAALYTAFETIYRVILEYRKGPPTAVQALLAQTSVAQSLESIRSAASEAHDTTSTSASTSTSTHTSATASSTSSP